MTPTPQPATLSDAEQRRLDRFAMLREPTVIENIRQAMLEHKTLAPWAEEVAERLNVAAALTATGADETPLFAHLRKSLDYAKNSPDRRLPFGTLLKQDELETVLATLDTTRQERDAAVQELAAVRHAAHMPDDYEFGLPSYVNQVLYMNFIGAKISEHIYQDVISGRLTFPESPAEKRVVALVQELAELRPLAQIVVPDTGQTVLEILAEIGATDNVDELRDKAREHLFGRLFADVAAMEAQRELATMRGPLPEPPITPPTAGEGETP
jgi:hypothetical protein